MRHHFKVRTRKLLLLFWALALAGCSLLENPEVDIAVYRVRFEVTGNAAPLSVDVTVVLDDGSSLPNPGSTLPFTYEVERVVDRTSPDLYSLSATYLNANPDETVTVTITSIQAVETVEATETVTNTTGGAADERVAVHAALDF